MDNKNVYARYKDVKAFLQMHMQDYSVERVMKAASMHLTKEGKLLFDNNRIFDNVDVTRLEDDEFEKLLDELPVRMNESFFDNIDDIDNLIPEMNRCHLLRILNEIPKANHRHDFLEIVYVWKGFCRMECDGISYLLKEGDFLFVSPKKVHNVDVEDMDSIIFNLVISRESFENILLGILALDHAVSYYIKNSLFGSKKGGLHIEKLNDQGNNLVRYIIKMAVAECGSEHEGHLLMLDSLVSQLLCVIIKYSDKTGSIEEDEQITEVLNYIQDNFRTVTMQQLAEHFGYEESYMCRIIKKATGKTFSEIIRSIRIEKAKYYLLNSKLPAKVIADQVGYNNTSVFFRAFKKEVGMSAAAFAEQNQNM